MKFVAGELENMTTKNKFKLKQTGVVLTLKEEFVEAYSPTLNRVVYLHQYCQVVRHSYIGAGNFSCIVTDSDYKYSDSDYFTIHKSQLQWYCVDCSNRFPVSNDENHPICDDCAIDQDHIDQ
jgi:hypothetical protein